MSWTLDRIDEIKKELKLTNDLLHAQVTYMYMLCKVLNHDKTTNTLIEEMMASVNAAVDERTKERT